MQRVAINQIAEGYTFTEATERLSINAGMVKSHFVTRKGAARISVGIDECKSSSFVLRAFRATTDCANTHAVVPLHCSDDLFFLSFIGGNQCIKSKVQH